MEHFTIPSRVRALREMAGYRNMAALASALKEQGNVRGLGETKLRLIERGERIAEARELQEVAELCGVPLAWFTADFSRLDEVSENPRAVIAREMKDAAERLGEPPADTSEAPPPQPPADPES
ncbi:MAG: helix-turn-helix domain-containing protein [Acidiferrobacteraceae bacterium]